VHEGVHEELRALVRDRGLRATSARLAVLFQLHERGAPMTHEEVMEAVGHAAIDKATVYRILADLARVDVLVRMDLGDRVWRYELRDPCRDVSAHHPHFLCDTCSRVVCLPGLELRPAASNLPSALLGADITLRATGRCGACVQRP
jgi:Fur family ferric uptake transcriptional regulator